MGFWNEFCLVFSEISWLSAVFIILGIIFIIIEIFQPGFGVFGVTGAIFAIIGIAIRMHQSNGGNPIIQFFVLVALCGIIISIALIIMVWSLKKGWLSKTGFVQKSTSVSSVHSEGTLDFREMVGKFGITLCDLHPSGLASIEGQSYDVVSDANFIEKGEPIEVVRVEGVRIVVKRLNSNLNK